MFKNIVITISLLFLFVSAAVSAQDRSIDFSIRYYNKQIYYPESDIMLKLMIRNNSSRTYRFKLADQRVFNLGFDVRTLQNMVLSPSDKFIIETTSNQPRLYREISLEPGEEFSFYTDLNEYVAIPRAGTYIVTLHFYPELKRDHSHEFLSSNQLTLSVRPSVDEVKKITDRIEEKTGEILRHEDMPPDKVVSYTLNARQKGQWDKFFLYLDIERLLRKDDARERQYLRLNEEGRKRMLEEFKEDLRNQVVDTDIVVVPNEFEILSTAYTPSEGSVQVLERFRYPDYTEIKRYTYYVRREDDIWYIYDYDVRNLGTE